MIATNWNKQFYDPQAPVKRKTEVHFKRGEIYAHVYAAILAGVNTVRELVICVGRCDERIHEAIHALEHHGYIERMPGRIGRQHSYAWRVIK